MLIAQISDLHLPDEGTLTYGHVDTAGALERIIAHVNALRPLPDLAVISGDLTDAGSLAQTTHARALLAGLDCPYVVLPGNHDRRASLREIFAPANLPAAPGPFLHYALDYLPLRLLMLDSLDEGAPGGALCRARLDWLEARLAEAPERATMLFLHHPPAALGVPETDQDGFAGAEALARLVAAYPNIQRIAAGHIHLATTTLWQGRPLVTAPATIMQLSCDFTADPPPSRFSLAPPAYLLHRLTGTGGLVSQVVTLGEDGRRFDFAPLEQPC